MLRLFVLCLTLAACHSTPAPPYRPIGSELIQNPVFVAWSRGLVRPGCFQQNALTEKSGVCDAADFWVAKWTASAASHMKASKDPAGMRYDLYPSGPESFYARQYIGDANWFLGKKIRLTAVYSCSPSVTRVWWYLHFRWNKNQEDAPGVTVLSETSSVSNGIVTKVADVLMPPNNPKYPLDASAGFVPSLNMDTASPGWCVINKISAVQIAQ